MECFTDVQMEQAGQSKRSGTRRPTCHALAPLLPLPLLQGNPTIPGENSQTKNLQLLSL